MACPQRVLTATRLAAVPLALALAVGLLLGAHAASRSSTFAPRTRAPSVQARQALTLPTWAPLTQTQTQTQTQAQAQAVPSRAPQPSLFWSEELPLRWSYPALVNDDARAASQLAPAVAVDNGGALHAVWVDYRDGSAGGAIYYARRPAGAVRWESNRRVSGGDDGVLRLDPAVAVDSQGGVHVVWSEARAGQPDIIHRFLPRGLAVWSAPVRVNADVGSAAQLQPVVAADLWGSVHVVWVDYRSGGPALYYGRRLADGSWSTNSRVTEWVQGPQADPALTATKTGDVYVVWQESRDGKSDIYASRLPPGGDVWWPPHELSASAGRSLEHLPAVAADSTGAVHALWIDDGAGGALRMATLRPEEPMWDADRVVYRPTRGELLSTALAGGPGGQVVALWGESRPDGDRLYSAAAVPVGALVAVRVDDSPTVTHSRTPVAAIDPSAWAHAVWVGLARDGQPEVYHTSAQLATPSYDRVELRGWLEYRPGDWNCAGDGFMTETCDGSRSPLIVPRGVDPTPFLGSYVVVTGARVSDTGCTHVTAAGIKLATTPCPRNTGVLTGVLGDEAGPVEGATVYLGTSQTTTGATGRFFFDRLEPGAYPLTATLPCALLLSAGETVVMNRPLTTVPTARFVRGEVVADCVVDLRDLVRVTAQYKKQSPFHPACSDQDGDGTVSMADIVVVAAAYGQACPVPWDGRPPTNREDRVGRTVAATPFRVWLPLAGR